MMILIYKGTEAVQRKRVHKINAGVFQFQTYATLKIDFF